MLKWDVDVHIVVTIALQKVWWDTIYDTKKLKKYYLKVKNYMIICVLKQENTLTHTSQPEFVLC